MIFINKIVDERYDKYIDLEDLTKMFNYVIFPDLLKGLKEVVITVVCKKKKYAFDAYLEDNVAYIRLPINADSIWEVADITVYCKDQFIKKINDIDTLEKRLRA